MTEIYIHQFHTKIVLKLFYDSYINNKPPEIFDFSKESQLTYTKKQIEKVWFDRKTKDIL